MKYSLDGLKDQIIKGYKPNYIFFWREFNSTNTISKTCLSQWYNAIITFKNKTFNTSEHLMMAKKAHLFGDLDSFNKILNAQTPAEAKSLGRQVKNFDEAIWGKERFDIVVNVNLLKFSQHKDLQEFLLSTNDSVLVEASPYDTIWGIGLDENHPNAKDPFKWKGLNLLGFALMNVRDRLKNS